MSVVLFFAWILVGITSTPWIMADMRRRGDPLVKDPALEAFIGALLGPLPLLMYIGYFVFRTIGRLMYRVIGQTEVTQDG